MQPAIATEYDNYIREDLEYYYDAEVVDMKPAENGGELPFTDFVSEIDAWARHALASNGFGDF